jgi:hypothetical protein
MMKNLGVDNASAIVSPESSDFLKDVAKEQVEPLLREEAELLTFLEEQAMDEEVP